MKEAETIYKENLDSIVVVRTHSSEGSGVVVGDNLIATNAHVVDGGGKINVWPVSAGQSDMVEAEIIAASDCDLCLLETKGLSLSSVKIGATKDLRVGQPVYAIGVPLSLGGTLSNGIVSRLWNPSGSAHALPGPLIQTNAEISSGSSGGGLFDADGRLVGITTFRRGNMNNLNFAVPVEMVDQLRQCDEKELRRKINKLLACDTNWKPEDIISLAWNISVASSPELEKSLAHLIEMGRCAAMLGDKDLPQKISESLRQFTNQEQSPEIASAAALSNAMVLSSMGKEYVDKAVCLIESLDKTAVLQAHGYAVIVADCARHEGRHSLKAREIYKRIMEIPEDVWTDVAKDPGFVGALTAAKVAMNDSEDALIIADKHINEQESAGHFLEFVGALGEIAATLRRQNVAIGAMAIFRYARYAAINHRVRGVGVAERLVALGGIAVSAAECGDDHMTDVVFNEMEDVRKKGAASNLPRDGTPDIAYRRQIEARGLEARARAIIGGWLETHTAFEVMKRIPVLEHLPVALVCIACRKRQEAKAEND